MVAIPNMRWLLYFVDERGENIINPVTLVSLNILHQPQMRVIDDAIVERLNRPPIIQTVHIGNTHEMQPVFSITEPQLERIIQGRQRRLNLVIKQHAEARSYNIFYNVLIRNIHWYPEPELRPQSIIETEWVAEGTDLVATLPEELDRDYEAAIRRRIRNRPEENAIEAVECGNWRDIGF